MNVVMMNIAFDLIKMNLGNYSEIIKNNIFIVFFVI